MRVHLQEEQQDKQDARLFIKKVIKPKSNIMNNNLQINPLSVKTAVLVVTCLLLVLQFYK